MKLRTISLFTLITLALVASLAQAGSITQYGVFPISGGGPQIFSTAAAANAAFACFGTVTNGYSDGSSPSACSALSGSAVSNNNVSGGTSDETQTLQNFQFQGFNVAGNTLNSITFQIANYTYILSNAFAGTGANLSYNMTNQIQLATSNTQSAGLLTNPFYQDYLNSTNNVAAYNQYSVPNGTTSSTVTDYSSEDSTATVTQSGLAPGAKITEPWGTKNDGVNNFTTSALNAAFTGAGTVNLYWNVLGVQSESGPANAQVFFSDYAGAEIIITYNYSPNPTGTPEPATLLLLGSGLTFVAARLRRRKTNA